MIELKLLPTGKRIAAPVGSALSDLLISEGVEFVCGGKGTCKGCRVKVLERAWDPNEAEVRALGAELLADGWRLACQARVSVPLTIEVAQWEMPILTDHFDCAGASRDGLGIAVDLGTTTIAAQLLDLQSGDVLGVASALNAQAVYGADIMTRLEEALNGAAEQLTRKVRRQIGGLIDKLIASTPVTKRRKLREVLIAGNTVMHHLFSALPITTLAQYPFEPASAGTQHFTSDELGWSWPHAEVTFLPCLGGFVGSDLLAGILATELDQSDQPVALIDLGTNGEIVVGNKSRIVCASTAAGPAFEGARISMGMRAATGAISAVSYDNDELNCRVIGGTPPRGLCGSGLVDAVAAGLDRRVIETNGRFAQTGTAWPLAGRVSLAQRDIRELQLAKGAIATGLQMLCHAFGVQTRQLAAIYLAGAFGNYINPESARRISLLPDDVKNIIPIGNAALRGTKLALLRRDETHIARIRALTEHFALQDDPEFETKFFEQLQFPAGYRAFREPKHPVLA